MVRVARFAALILSLLSAACTTEQAAPPAPVFYANLASPDAQVDVAGAAGLINLYRRNNGLAPLAPDGALAAMARKEAEAMARAGAPASAEALKVRLAAEGVRLPAVNISAGYHTMAEAFSGWRDSPAHNRTMLDASATRFGIATAYASAAKYKVYWVLIVAAN